MTEPTVTLKPCPFCGVAGVAVISGPCAWNQRGIAWNVMCPTRDCHGGIFALGCDMFASPAEAIAAWNTRTASAPAPVEVTQGDMDAARKAWREAYDAYMDWYTAKDEVTPVRMLAQAFARHRTASAPADLVEAVKWLLEEYVSNVDSYRMGGFYLDPEKEECVVEARAALAKHGGA
jgi:hypothetical protein